MDPNASIQDPTPDAAGEPIGDRPSLAQRITAMSWARARSSVVAPQPRAWLRPWPRLLVVGLALATLALVAPFAHHARAAAFLLRLQGGAVPAAARLAERDVAVGDRFSIPLELSGSSATAGDVAARLYVPVGVSRPRGVVLAHGVHFMGIDEPRLVSLAQSLARSGLVVLTPQLAPLADYHVDDPGNLSALRAAVHYLAHRTDLVGDGGVGLIGVSFAGGLSLRVASEPGVGSELAYVVSIGGHHDLRAVARFFASDEQETPHGKEPLKAHDYGVAVFVYATPERFVSADDAPKLKIALRYFLYEAYAMANEAAAELSPDGRRVFDLISNRDTRALGKRLLEILPDISQPMLDASPVGHIASIRVPIYLLHGAHDNVVPPAESEWVAAEARRDQEVHLLVTKKIGHAELGEDDSAMDTWRLVDFMSDMIAE